MQYQSSILPILEEWNDLFYPIEKVNTGLIILVWYKKKFVHEMGEETFFFAEDGSPSRLAFKESNVKFSVDRSCSSWLSTWSPSFGLSSIGPSIVCK